MKKQHNVRNVILYTIIFNLLGWLGWFLAQDGTEDAVGLGNLIWLAAPFILSLIFRLFRKDWQDLGLAPHFKGNWKWYLFSIAAFPIMIGIVLLIGKLAGSAQFGEKGFTAFLSLAAAAFGTSLVKNIFEEFAWRGYLTPKVNAITKKPILGHLIVGLIWGTWHIPYYLGLVDQTVLASYTHFPMGVFIPLVIISITLAGILFGELRLVTGSTWPALLMHTTSNAIILTLLVNGMVSYSQKTAILFSPSWEGILMMVLITAAGLWLYQQRKENK